MPQLSAWVGRDGTTWYLDHHSAGRHIVTGTIPVQELHMPVPGYQEFMLPLLRLAADGSEHTVNEAMDVLARQLRIADSDREAMLPSGTQTRY